jgi:hypothetical protein
VWLSFVILGSLLAGAVWVVQRTQWGRWQRIAALALLAAGATITAFVTRSPITLGAGSGAWYSATPIPEIYYFVVMMVGMAGRYVTRAIEERREKIVRLEKTGEPFQKPNLEFDRWEFAYPFFLSIVTYGALLSQLPDSTFSLTGTALSFQTGFFWQTIIGARQAKVSV